MTESTQPVKNHLKEIFKLTQKVPEYTDQQLKKKYFEIRGEEAPEANRDWLLEAVIRLIQHHYYFENDLKTPENIEESFQKFFKEKITFKKKRKTPRKKGEVNREVLNQERIRLLHLVAETCKNLIPNGNITFHPQNKYASIKSSKSVVMYIEKKLKKITAYMGGERNRSQNPKIHIRIGTEDQTIKNELKSFVEENLKDFMHVRNKRWEKCSYVLSETIKCFKTELTDYNDIHSHPSGRYTTFKKGRSVLVFITQDRAKGEVSFHPGGERENNPELTTTIKVGTINDRLEIKNKVVEFLSSHYQEYLNGKKAIQTQQKKELKKILEVCSSVVTHDAVFQHPNDFFGLIKNEEKPLLMIKRNGEEGCYNIVAWIKKQKNNPSIAVNLLEEEDEKIADKTKELVKKHLKL